MEKDAQPAKPRLTFGRGPSATSAPARKHVPVEDALARMAGKIGERRRALPRAGEDEDDGTGVTA